MSNWSYSDLLKLVEIKDKNIDHYLERITELESELERTHKALDVASAENMPGPIKLYVCADGSVYDNLDVAKSHAASIFNPLPTGATTTDRAHLEQELIRTRKALGKAKWWLHEIVESHRCTPISTAEMALKEITALEQKDVK